MFLNTYRHYLMMMMMMMMMMTVIFFQSKCRIICKMRSTILTERASPGDRIFQ